MFEVHVDIYVVQSLHSDHLLLLPLLLLPQEQPLPEDKMEKKASSVPTMVATLDNHHDKFDNRM
jgi:hypothetical protein